MTHLEYIIKNVSLDMDIRFQKVLNQYQIPYSIAGLDGIREEICKCLIFGFYQASITLTNFLFENALKTLLIYKYMRDINASINDFEKIEDGIKKYDGKLLDKSIEEAFNKQLITKDEKKDLFRLMEKYRNPFSHADKRKIFGQDKSIVEEFKFDKQELYTEKKEFLKSSLLPYHDFFLLNKSEKESFEYFYYIDSIIRKIHNSIK